MTPTPQSQGTSGDQKDLPQIPMALKDCHHCTRPCTHTGENVPAYIPCPTFIGISRPRAGEVFIRKSVLDFALLMELKLRKNDHKGHWSKESFTYLFGRLDDERKELDKEVARQRSDYNKIIDEATDEANFLMMIVDNLNRMKERAP